MPAKHQGLHGIDQNQGMPAETDTSNVYSGLFDRNAVYSTARMLILPDGGSGKTAADVGENPEYFNIDTARVRQSQRNLPLKGDEL